MKKIKSIGLIIVNTIAAAVGAWFIAWGPLGLGFGGQSLFPLIGGAISAWAWNSRRSAVENEHEALARRWNRALWSITITLVLGISGLCFFQFYNLGFFPDAKNDRLAAYDQMCKRIGSIYPYFELKQVDWTSLCREYRNQTETAATDDEFYEVVDALLLELGDSHTYLDAPVQIPHHTFALVAEIEGKAVVTKAGKIAREAGLAPGSVILEIDGSSIDSILAGMDDNQLYGSTPWQRQMNAYASLLSTTSDRLRVTFETNEGEKRTEDLIWGSTTYQVEEKSTPAEPIISGERLSSGIGYINIPTFQAKANHNLVVEFDTALDSLSDAAAMIIDIRGNPGGSTWISDRIAGRFFQEPFTYGREYYRRRLPLFAWRLWMDYQIQPRGEPYTGNVVVLIDGINLSTAEEFAVAMQDSGRAILIGARTSGGSGNPICSYLLDSKVCFSTGDFRRLDGIPIEGVGVVPDIEVNWSIEDVRSGSDPVMEYAVDYLQP